VNEPVPEPVPAKNKEKVAKACARTKRMAIGRRDAENAEVRREQRGKSNGAKRANKAQRGVALTKSMRCICS